MYLKKFISVLLIAILVIGAVYLFTDSKKEIVKPTPEEKKTDVIEEEKEEEEKEEVNEEETKDDEEIAGEQVESFTFDPFTITMAKMEGIDVGEPFTVEAELKNTYNGPVTLAEGSKCTKEVTFTFVPFSEYEEGQSAPNCIDSTERVELKVGESMTTKAELIADKDEPYILSAYFANIPLLKKVVPVGNENLDEVTESDNVGSSHLDITAEGTFKTGQPVYLSTTLSNKGENFVRMKENSCKHDFEFIAKVNDDNINIPGNYGPCEDDGRSFNLQAGDSINGYASFVPEKAGTYTVTVSHVNDIMVELEFIVD